MSPTPSALAFVPFVSVQNMMKLVHHIGIERLLIDMAAEIEADFRRWPDFDKTPRVASHSDVGACHRAAVSCSAACRTRRSQCG